MDEDTFFNQIDQVIKELNVHHASSLAANIASHYKAGSDGAGYEYAGAKYAKKKVLSPLQEAAIQKLTAEHFGYMAEFDKAIGDTIKDHAKEILRSEGGYKDISEALKPYIKDVFEGKETVTIDHIGQTRTVLNVDKEGKLYKTEKTIQQKYTTNADAYADMLSQSATHKAFEQGRASEYQRMKFNKWRFTGPSDERARPWHAAIIGNVYEYGTPESDMALDLLGEANCRHRAIAFFDDPKLDTPQDFYEKQKEKAGLYWDDETEAWAFK